MPAIAPVGSEPLSTVNGAPLWRVKNELICQPPSTLPSSPCWSRIHGSSHTKLPVRRCGRSNDRPGLVVVDIERVLGNRDLTARRIEDLRGRVEELAPSVVEAGAQPAAEPLVEAGLQRVIPGLRFVGAQPDHASRVVDTRAGRATRTARRGLPSSVWNRSLPSVPTYPTRMAMFVPSCRWNSRLN